MNMSEQITVCEEGTPAKISPVDVAKVIVSAAVEIPIISHRRGTIVTDSQDFDYRVLNPDGTFDF